MSDNSTGGGGLGLAGVLTAVFVTLRLTNLISWPWVWVLSPVWISFIIGVAILLIAFVVAKVKNRIK